ncbi:hypothetical protein GGR53DRAFT_506736 [Hypoxylon sp. FL1150]|nr:hypothetical protein GGR53DRAFT_506736 [Hypoxylon sp. FL1150]
MDLLHAVFNHIVLPPKLPGVQDPDIEAVSHNVLVCMINACNAADILVDSPWSDAFRSIRASLQACSALNQGCLEKSTLCDHFGALEPHQVLILHVVEQNAAVLIRREDYDSEQRVVFESFETSATSEQILAAGHAVQWDFPGRSAQLPLATFSNKLFQECLAAFLEQASAESLYNLQASTQKANVSIPEARDTTNPALITQMLMPLLEALGSFYHAPVLRKRIRDEVNVKDATLPWRRLPFWLTLRVAAQRQFCLILGNELGRIAYKFLLCLLLAELLEEATGKLSPDLVVTLRAKLCRRMAKLESERANGGPLNSDPYASLFDRICPKIQRSIQEATSQVERAWNSFKHATTRQVPLLPFRAPDHALQLSLHNSGAHIDGLLNSRPGFLRGNTSLNLPQPLDRAIRQMQDFTDRIFRLAAMELLIDQVDHNEESGRNTSRSHETRCTQLATHINQVFTEAGTIYDSDPQQMSAMILTLFTLWVRLDKCAIAACPLLADYRPIFNPELLDVLQLPTLSDMRRLWDIQSYLAQRHSGCRYGTIFSKIDNNCLAVRYALNSPEMQSLGTRIQNASDRARIAKEVEWRRACEEYDDHTVKFRDGTCSCTRLNGELDVRGCSKCWHRRARKRMKIEVHEALLPADNPARDALLFELAIPKYLSAYRDATWRICALAYPTQPVASSTPEIELIDCEPLQSYSSADKEGISLASPIKCFDQTHYKFQSGKVPLSQLLLPLGARFELYDRRSKRWVKDFNEPFTFEHLCGIFIPNGLRGTVLPVPQHPLQIVDGPTSYEVQANQTECPSHMSLHEFSAFQKLLSGQARRWLNIITEMGSSNLNLSNQDTTHVLGQLAIQAGSSLPGEVLRTPHIIFKEPDFVERLIDIIDRRLRAILTNWRERYSMELLITLTLRLFSLSSGTLRDRAAALLHTARDITINWTTCLKTELRTATDADTAQRIALYGLCAALLCRRTFASYAEISQPMSARDLSSWIQASVALQENLVVDLDKLPQNVKSMFLRDTKAAYHLQSLLKVSIQNHPDSVGDGIARAWSDVSDTRTTVFTAWCFLDPPHSRWIVARASESQNTSSASQTIHYNVVEGHLLIDGKPRGKLPSEIRDSEEVKDMFGKQHLLTYPSALPGMTHRLSNPMHGQDVHFGMRGGQVVIRAWNRERRQLLEFIPKGYFTTSDSFDLPAELVDNCIHWLNLTTRRLEIRRAPAIWVKRPKDWEIDIPTRVASRGNVHLVDPRSDTFAQIAKTLEHFEQPEKVTVFQPKGKLSVELRHLELSFVVNKNNLLECRQLNMEIDPNQDAGTWYGLLSKIVLRDTLSKERSIIVPLGQANYIRHGMHVDVRVSGANEYGKYGIDIVLDRLTCPLEPRLLYAKAHYHALTSFCLPDPLTGRTGTEEAFSILHSGASQPWAPLGGSAHEILNALGTLPPRREYYPKGMKRFQSVTWSKHLTATIQHDGFTSIIQDIVTRSNNANEFFNGTTKSLAFNELSHLCRRGEVHRRLYERPMPDISSLIEAGTAVTVYNPRDRNVSSRAARVYEVVRLIATGCRSLHLQTTFKSFLESIQVIGGFGSGSISLDSQEPLINQTEDSICENWGDLIQLCRHADHTEPLFFRLGLLAFCPDSNMDVIRSLAAFATVDKLKALSPPLYSSFTDFKSRGQPSIDVLEALITPAHYTFTPIRRRRRAELRDRAGRNAQEHQDLCEEQGQELAVYFRGQWPASADELITLTFDDEVIDTSLALDEIRSEWERRRKNSELESWINQVQIILRSINGPRDTSRIWEGAVANPTYFGLKPSGYVEPTARDLLLKACPPLERLTFDISSGAVSPAIRNGNLPFQKKQFAIEVTELETILTKFSSSGSLIRQQYAGDLLQSLAVLKNTNCSTEHGAGPPLMEVNHAIDWAYRTTMMHLKSIFAALTFGDRQFQWLRLGTLSPCTTPTEVLSLLRSASDYRYGPGMKEGLVQYGLAITHLQRLRRIRQILLEGREPYEELRNPGHENWSPLQMPDWLLLEIDGNILIRAEQVDVAKAMIAPPSGHNSVLQMNMGKGKTSCIVPMVVSALADGRSLARLIVPKALLMQTAQTTQLRLGGLIGREVLHLPFSRKTKSTANMLALYEHMHQNTCSRRGLILTSHEHVLSYKLGGWQYLADGKLDTAVSMTSFQHWLDGHCRDILDECDFTLAVKTQLNYPSGPEMAVDGHPYRWQVAQELLVMAANYVPTLRKKFPCGIEVLERPGSFPIIHILSSDVEDAVHSHILDSICAGRTTFLRPVDSGFPRWQHIIRSVLSDRHFDEQKFRLAVLVFSNPQAASKMLLVARGLLMNRILLLCLGKRWNVQYGLHPGRYPVAVPFEAKGKPSEQSEFGHPDVAILFTCLAFYYTGLTSKQFLQGLQKILQSDDPAAHYEQWISSSNNLPEALRHWNIINVDDGGQMEELWGCLRSNRVVINHYLNNFVFPVHAKQFDIKLQASAWDLPLYGRRGVGTTGFSGTNDNRAMLPLTIQQDDLPSLKQTSAEVLSYLLQPRNRSYQVTTNPIGKRLTETGLLELLHKDGIRVLIDAGAYILEMDNEKLAQAWLGIDHQASAAVYFGADNRAWVHYKGEKHDVPLLATPFADDLSGCVVYLDEAHTRGVDLKLPQQARGALTLALKQTKDFTMQAAMRLRQLRTTQSVTFLAPPEVDQSIRDFCRPAFRKQLDSSHVIAWLLEQTCHVNEELQSLYVAQGLDFCQRTDAVWKHGTRITDTVHRAKLLDVLQQPERQTLEQLYGGASAEYKTGSVDRLLTPQLQAFTNQLNRRGAERSMAIQTGALEEVEQEREVQEQVEEVRMVQKPARYEALTFPGLHPIILRFARTGILDYEQLAAVQAQDAGFEQAFAYVARTGIGQRFGVRATNSRLFVSTQFGRTIAYTKRSQVTVDNFLRPVEWILWSPSTQTALVIIPEEAEQLIPLLRRRGAGRSPVHLLTYAAPVTKAMLSFNNFDYYTLPSLPPGHRFPAWFRLELGLLSGRLYVHSAEWNSVCRYLRSPSGGGDDTGLEPMMGDEIVPTADAVAKDPASFLLEWLTLLRKTQDVLQTPMGYICTGRAPGENHPFLSLS